MPPATFYGKLWCDMIKGCCAGAAIILMTILPNELSAQHSGLWSGVIGHSTPSATGIRSGWRSGMRSGMRTGIRRGVIYGSARWRREHRDWNPSDDSVRRNDRVHLVPSLLNTLRPRRPAVEPPAAPSVGPTRGVHSYLRAPSRSDIVPHLNWVLRRNPVDLFKTMASPLTQMRARRHHPPGDLITSDRLSSRDQEGSMFAQIGKVSFDWRSQMQSLAGSKTKPQRIPVPSTTDQLMRYPTQLQPLGSHRLQRKRLLLCPIQRCSDQRSPYS